MKLIIHDLRDQDFKKIFSDHIENSIIISNDGNINNCIGCFGCWIKTPGKCIIKDDYSNMGEYLSKASELIIVSECFYGSYSPFIKNVLDRSISYILPYFKIVKGLMRHKRRYKNNINMKVFFYGDDIKDNEKKTAEELVHANAQNFYAKANVFFIGDIMNSSLLTFKD